MANMNLFTLFFHCLNQMVAKLGFYRLTDFTLAQCKSNRSKFGNQRFPTYQPQTTTVSSRTGVL